MVLRAAAAAGGSWVSGLRFCVMLDIVDVPWLTVASLVALDQFGDDLRVVRIGMPRFERLGIFVEVLVCVAPKLVWVALVDLDVSERTLSSVTGRAANSR